MEGTYTQSLRHNYHVDDHEGAGSLIVTKKDKKRRGSKKKEKKTKADHKPKSKRVMSKEDLASCHGERTPKKRSSSNHSAGQASSSVGTMESPAATPQRQTSIAATAEASIPPADAPSLEAEESGLGEPEEDTGSKKDGLPSEPGETSKRKASLQANLRRLSVRLTNVPNIFAYLFPPGCALTGLISLTIATLSSKHANREHTPETTNGSLILSSGGAVVGGSAVYDPSGASPNKQPDEDSDRSEESTISADESSEKSKDKKKSRMARLSVNFDSLKKITSLGTSVLACLLVGLITCCCPTQSTVQRTPPKRSQSTSPSKLDLKKTDYPHRLPR